MTSDDLMLVSPVYGFGGVYFSLLSYIRKAKSHTPVNVAYPAVTYQNLAFWVYLTQLMLRLVGLDMLSKDFYLSTVAILFSWTYLSFVYKDSEGNVGTKSDDFKFVNMFPVVLHPIAVPLSTAFYNIFVIMGLFPALEGEKKSSQHHLRQSNDSIAGSNSSQLLAPKADVVSERRRAKAQKLLDEKMKELSKQTDDWEEKEEHEKV